METYLQASIANLRHKRLAIYNHYQHHWRWESGGVGRVRIKKEVQHKNKQRSKWNEITFHSELAVR